MKIVIDNGCFMPTRGHEHDAGMDLRTPTAFGIKAGGSAVIDTGVHVQIPIGMVGMLKSKSGLNVKHGITSEGVIDTGYTGSVRCKLYNHGNEDVSFKKGDKITQLVIMPIYLPETLEVVDSLEETERGANGFGSTGR